MRFIYHNSSRSYKKVGPMTLYSTHMLIYVHYTLYSECVYVNIGFIPIYILTHFLFGLCLAKTFVQFQSIYPY